MRSKAKRERSRLVASYCQLADASQPLPSRRQEPKPSTLLSLISSISLAGSPSTASGRSGAPQQVPTTFWPSQSRLTRCTNVPDTDGVPITPVQFHQQLLATVRVRRTYIRLHRLTSPSHRSRVRQHHSALPHTSRSHSTIVVVLPLPRHTLQRLRSSIYHHLDIHRLARSTHRHRRLFHQHPHAIRHSRRLSIPPLHDIPLRAPFPLFRSL